MKPAIGSCLLVLGCVLAPTALVRAQEQPDPDTKDSRNEVPDAELPETTIGDEFRVDSTEDTIGATVVQAGRRGVEGPVSTSSTNTPRCTHRPATYGEFPNVVPPDGSIPEPDDQIMRDDNGRADTGWIRECPGGGTEPFYWAPAAVDPVDLVPNALADARRRLPAPTPAINPDASAGGIVNLGMWLAVDDPGTTTARAELAGVWAQVAATASNITVDLGNGDTITCDGLGSPIPETALDSLDQGPCGYTYRQSSPDDDPYQLTITTAYAVEWTTSNGQRGTLTPITRSVTLDYDVDEIQTIGISN